MSNVIGTEWEMPVVLAGMYGLRMSEIIGLRTFNIDLEKMQFGVVEQMPFKVPPGTKTITEMAPTKSNDRILPITEETLPYFLRQFDLIERQKALIEASGGVYYDNKLFKAALLRSHSGKLTPESAEQILSGELNRKPRKATPPTFKVKAAIYKKYFTTNISQKEFDSIVDEALALYFAQKEAISV